MSTSRSPEEDKLATVLEVDDQVRACLPRSEIVTAVTEGPQVLSETVEIVMHGYADRPALGERPVADDGALATHHETITYGELWRRARSVATAWQDPSRPLLAAGDIACSLAHSGIDHAVLDLALVATGAVSVPLAPMSTAAAWAAVLRETSARVLAVGADLLDGVLAALPPEVLPPAIVVLGGARSSSFVEAAVRAARARLAAAGQGIVVCGIEGLDRRGRDLPPAPLFVAASDTDPLAQLLYTSGSTGTPKGAMFPERLVLGTWRSFARMPWPAIVLHHAPMSHIAGRVALAGTLARGGTCYFVGRGDMSTLLEDFSLVRPTELSVVPRVCEMLHDRFVGEVGLRVAAGSGVDDARRDAATDLRDRVLGGRVVVASNGSALLGDDLREVMETVLGLPLHEGFGTTEAGGPIMLDHKLMRPVVTDHKLVDVPELGYFSTDRPFPRGELLVKTTSMIPGYYGRPELAAELFDADGFCRTGDVMAQTGPDEYRFVDRRHNVVKLAQAEFVAVSQVEEVLLASPLVRQIFVHAHAGWSYLLAVVVPTADAAASFPDDDALRDAVLRSVRERAAAAELRPYEIPRDVLVERSPFTVDDGLLSALGKLLRPRLVERYDARLVARYAELAGRDEEELAALRRDAGDRPVIDTVAWAAATLVGASGERSDIDRRFVDLGGDSLAALAFSGLLTDVFGVDVPVGVIVAPTTTLRDVARFVDVSRTAVRTRATARSVHGDTTTLRADALTLAAFVEPPPAPVSPPRSAGRRTVLLTGANGFLGRFLAVELLEDPDTRVVCLLRGEDRDDARRRLERALGTDPTLVERFRRLAADRLEVVVGDVAQERLGVDPDQWRHLVENVDTIVHAAALVNHLLPYEQLFGPNVAGTAEVVRLAVTGRLKEVVFTSTVGIARPDGAVLDEDDDIRIGQPTREPSAGYAQGYATSKWAAEVLLRKAHEHYGLPVTVLRSGLLLAHRRYAGQVNAADVLTRILTSVLLTGVAPTSFGRDEEGDPAPRYGGVPVDFVAASTVALGVGHQGGHRTYNAVDDRAPGPSLDLLVDWLVEASESVTRVDDHDEWLHRWEVGLRDVPDRVAGSTALPLLDSLRAPGGATPRVSAGRFLAAVRAAGLGEQVPGPTRELLAKYASDLRGVGVLGG